MPRVLVTAALGNVGHNVVEQCAARGLEVRAAGLERAVLERRFPGRDVCRFDFLDRSTWAPALAGTQLLFLLRPPPLGDMDTTLCPFVDAAYESGVEHIVFLSVAGADRMKWVPHRKVELHLMKTGAAWTLLRPGFFAQNLQDAYRRDIVEDARLYVPAGAGRVAFVDVADVAAIAARVLSDPEAFRGQALTVTGPEAITFDAAAATLSQALGRSIRYEPASIPGYVWHLKVKRHMAWMQVLVQTVLHVGLRRGDAERVEPTVERLLGRAPRTLADYVRGAAESWSLPAEARASGANQEARR
jgi:uncharacterized protein YbjT (DUF2867 family)